VSLLEARREVRLPLHSCVSDPKLVYCVAAVFFAVYDTLKQRSPLPGHLSPVTHVISASVAEVVGVLFSS
jgi:hypothetical protein